LELSSELLDIQTTKFSVLSGSYLVLCGISIKPSVLNALSDEVEVTGKAQLAMKNLFSSGN